MSKIAIVMASLAGGGGERLNINLAKDWLKKGHEVEIVLMSKNGKRKEELLPLIPQEINIINFGISRSPQIIFPLTRYLRRSLPDITLVAMWPITAYSVFAWLLSGKIGKLFLSEHMEFSVPDMKMIYKVYLKGMIKFTYPLANGIIAVSNKVKNDLLKICKLKENKVKVIYNPAATGALTSKLSQVERVKLWGGDYNYNILSVGNLKKQKDHKTLLNAFSLLPKNLNVKLIILGEGNLRKNLNNLIEGFKLNDKVDLPGFVLDPYPWYRSADLFVLSSIVEGFGNVLVESLEAGLPIVSTDCGGPAEILDYGRYGTLVNPSDPEALSSAIIKNLNKSHDRSILIKRSKDFSIDTISKKYLNYMENK